MFYPENVDIMFFRKLVFEPEDLEIPVQAPLQWHPSTLRMEATGSSITLLHPPIRPCNFNPLTYLLTPWCRVLLEQLTGLQLVKKFPAFHGTRRFITALTSVRHLSLSWNSPIQSTYPHPTSWRYILILSNHLRLGLPSGVFPSGFQPPNAINYKRRTLRFRLSGAGRRLARGTFKPARRLSVLFLPLPTHELASTDLQNSIIKNI